MTSMSTDIGARHLDQEPVMSRTVRLSVLLLCLAFVASCSDARDALSPDAHTLASSVSAVPDRAPAAAHDDGAGEDALPDDLSEIALFSIASASSGVQIASAVIGAKGGSLRLGDFEMVVPAGAVSSATHFSIRTFPEGNGRHAVASFLPHRTFDRPVTVRVPLDATASAHDVDAHVMWWDGHQWIPFPSSVTADGRLETNTSHFSIYGTECRRGFTLVGG
jgi:hypothetical protein